ncbi:MAG: hypothetical protein NXI01_04915 [Gammaproteobacteria bacterium]|nr:hypothetical protein [Gammaproteobacteria bacterium]
MLTSNTLNLLATYGQKLIDGSISDVEMYHLAADTSFKDEKGRVSGKLIYDFVATLGPELSDEILKDLVPRFLVLESLLLPSDVFMRGSNISRYLYAYESARQSRQDETPEGRQRLFAYNQASTDKNAPKTKGVLLVAYLNDSSNPITANLVNASFAEDIRTHFKLFAINQYVHEDDEATFNRFQQDIAACQSALKNAASDTQRAEQLTVLHQLRAEYTAYCDDLYQQSARQHCGGFATIDIDPETSSFEEITTALRHSYVSSVDSILLHDDKLYYLQWSRQTVTPLASSEQDEQLKEKCREGTGSHEANAEELQLIEASLPEGSTLQTVQNRIDFATQKTLKNTAVVIAPNDIGFRQVKKVDSPVVNLALAIAASPPEDKTTRDLLMTFMGAAQQLLDHETDNEVVALAITAVDEMTKRLKNGGQEEKGDFQDMRSMINGLSNRLTLVDVDLLADKDIHDANSAAATQFSFMQFILAIIQLFEWIFSRDNAYGHLSTEDPTEAADLSEKISDKVVFLNALEALEIQYQRVTEEIQDVQQRPSSDSNFSM